jgi:hypothetical protein
MFKRAQYRLLASGTAPYSNDLPLAVRNGVHRRDFQQYDCHAVEVLPRYCHALHRRCVGMLNAEREQQRTSDIPEWHAKL